MKVLIGAAGGAAAAIMMVKAEAQDGQPGLLGLSEPGRYHVTAEYAERRIETDVTVTAATLSSIAISPTLPKVAKGLTLQFKATGTFSDGSTQDVSAISSWSIKDVVTGTGVAVI